MARSNTTNKRVNLYINGKEAANSIKEVKAEMQKLVNEQARLKLGSDEYIAHAKKNQNIKRYHSGTQRLAKNDTYPLVIYFRNNQRF